MSNGQCYTCSKEHSLIETKKGKVCYSCYSRVSSRNKYGSKRVSYNGKTYDSIKEANRARELDLLKQAGDIWFYLEQVPFRLPGQKTYRLDFLIKWTDGRLTFEDTKGFMTQVSKIKIAQIEELYRIKIEVI